MAATASPLTTVAGERTSKRTGATTREYHLRRRYGIGQAHVERILAMQDGKCPGCGKRDPEHVDHDHATGEVRGLLCFNCNQALGNVRDDVWVLARLIDYLEACRSASLEERLARAEQRPVGACIHLYEMPPGLVIEYSGSGHSSRR
jgi:hypothetical protein